MTTKRPEDHPFRALWRGGDLDGWARAIDPGIVLRSPILSKPFQGRDSVIELYEVLLEVLSDLVITDEFTDGDREAFCWRGDVRGRQIEGVDLLIWNEARQISEVRVFVRTMADIGHFASAVGPPLARRQSPLRGALLDALGRPLAWILAAVDRASPGLGPQTD
jgi:hypothetical protein